MTALDVLGRAADLSQLALGCGLNRPLFGWVRRHRPDLFELMRHEPFAARGESFVREVGTFEKAAFVAKMLATDGGWSEPTRSPKRSLPCPAGDDELLFAGDILYPGALDAQSLSPALRARIARASCFVVNLEGTLADRPHELAPLQTRRGLRQLLAYESDPSDAGWASRLDLAGLRSVLGDARRAVVSVANNHTLDDGTTGFDATVESLRRADIGIVGDAREDDGAAIVEVGPHRVGLFGIAYGSNQVPSSDGRHLRFDAVPYRLSRERTTRIIGRLRRRDVTHIVAVLHWGHEHEHEPDAGQRACAASLFAAGVSAVVGHHPHLLQRSEQIGRGFISYSLGDFVGGDRTIWSRLGTLIALRFGPEGAVHGEAIPIAQTPFWARHATTLLTEAPPLERAVFERWFASKLPEGA